MENASELTDDAIIAEHNAASRIVAHAVLSLCDQYAEKGVTPLAILEGSLKASVLALAHAQGEKPADIADYLEGAAAAIRELPEDALVNPFQN